MAFHQLTSLTSNALQAPVLAPPVPAAPALRAAEYIWERLATQLGAKMIDMFSGSSPDAVLREWALGLEGFTRREVEVGIARCKLAKFAPTLGEFLHFCRPALDPEIAWREAETGLAARERGEAGEWSHPAVWRAATSFSWEIRSGEFRRCRNRWDHTLKKEFSAGWIEDVPPVPLKVEHKPTLKPMPDEVRQKLAAMGIKLGPKK